MSDKKSNSYLQYIFVFIAVALLLILQFFLHRMTPFIKDDLWYATNLTTGEAISNPMDIINSQIWHYFNWGGRIINHGLLQAVIATGELGADIINTLVTLLLGLIICLLSESKRPVMFLLAESAIVAFNASIHFSMFWESGSVNYLYSTCWILIFIFVIIRELKPNVSKLKAIEFWILPLALIAGWSTENMGPTCAFITLLVIVYKFINKSKPSAFLFEAFVMSSIGSALLILAPGNFVRNQFSNKMSLAGTIYFRIISIWNATSVYLLPVIVITLSVLVIEICIFKKKISLYNWALLIFAATAQLAMFLSPTYPQRTSFGIMSVLIAFIISICKNHIEDNKENAMITIATISIYIAALFIVVADILYPVFELVV